MLTICRKALWDQRRTLPAWASGIVLSIVLEAAMWPSVASMSSLDAYLTEFPDALKEMFSIEEMSTGTGFLNAELFSLMLPVLFIIFGILRGAHMIAGEEEAGTLDLLLVTPLSTTRLLLGEGLALAAGVTALGAATVVGTLAGSALFDLEIPVASALAGATACTLLGLVHGAIALTAGAVLGRRGPAIGVATGAALAAYVLYVGGLFVEGLSDAQVLSPFHQALQEGPLADAFPASFLTLLVVPLALVGVVLPVWARRDIGAHR
ncbi:ABC transporter permease subunit [Nocardioides daeguensis]|uniref:ABC transporter permease n=1 Tax=Nocardioides daeguensis TaxID=908359 RepID=A0ABP6UQY3_9ACTN|nr:ABC transporter permease subunit [Nocardioides daeguensis]MBV6728361.1 ABC transporter permease subunit [Nocardioides daeguensis]MCR1773170.1 ABC transporter permease subunit [Nocardioides daeguensis]